MPKHPPTLPEKILAELCPLLNQITRRERVSTWGSSWKLFACHGHFLSMEPKLFCLHRTKGTNNHIKQGDACFFARNPIGITYNQLPAMLTILFHNFLPDSEDLPNEKYPISDLIHWCTVFLTNSTNGGNCFSCLWELFIIFLPPFVDEANIQQMLPKVASEKGKKWPEWFWRTKKCLPALRCS